MNIEEIIYYFLNLDKLPKAIKLSGHGHHRFIFIWLKKPTQLGQMSHFHYLSAIFLPVKKLRILLNKEEQDMRKDEDSFIVFFLKKTVFQGVPPKK